MDDLIELFIQEHGSYQTDFKYKVIIFFIVILVICYKFLGNKYVSIIILLVFGLYMSNIFVKATNTTILDKNKDILFKLDSLQNKIYNYIEYKDRLIEQSGQKLLATTKQKILIDNKLDSLYIDSNMITFLYSIIQLAEYNNNEYYLLLKGTNNILKLKNEIEKFYESNEDYPETITELVENAIKLKTNCINNIHNFIYSIPKVNIMYEYIDDIINTYTILINRNIMIMYHYHQDYIRKHGVNNKTRFINLHFAKEFDAIDNHNVIPTKNNQKLLDLYI